MILSKHEAIVEVMQEEIKRLEKENKRLTGILQGIFDRKPRLPDKKRGETAVSVLCDYYLDIKTITMLGLGEKLIIKEKDGKIKACRKNK